MISPYQGILWQPAFKPSRRRCDFGIPIDAGVVSKKWAAEGGAQMSAQVEGAEG